MDLTARREALGSSSLCNGLEPELVDALAEIAEIQDYTPGQCVLAAGDPCDGLYVVVRGRARVDDTFAGETREVGHLEPGDFFGEVALLWQQKRSSSVFAQESLTCLILPGEPLKMLMEERPALHQHLDEVGSQRVESNLEQHLNLD